MGDKSVTSTDNDDVSSYNGSILELLFDVYAPLDKLGMILDDGPDGAMIYTCKGGSTLQNKVQYGDRIVAVNDKDVQHMYKLVSYLPRNQVIDDARLAL